MTPRGPPNFVQCGSSGGRRSPPTKQIMLWSAGSEWWSPSLAAGQASIQEGTGEKDDKSNIQLNPARDAHDTSIPGCNVYVDAAYKDMTENI